VTEGLKYGEKGPIAINSKLSNSSIVRGTQTSLILADSGTELANAADDDGLANMLRRFWDTDSIDICNDSHKPIITDKFFLRSVQ